eukprot:129363-Pyramimonas_sp.AAC.1
MTTDITPDHESPYSILVDELTQLALRAGIQLPTELTQLGQENTPGSRNPSGLSIGKRYCPHGLRVIHKYFRIPEFVLLQSTTNNRVVALLIWSKPIEDSTAALYG